jgi:hypothetical protein
MDAPLVLSNNFFLVQSNSTKSVLQSAFPFTHCFNPIEAIGYFLAFQISLLKGICHQLNVFFKFLNNISTFY